MSIPTIIRRYTLIFVLLSLRTLAVPVGPIVQPHVTFVNASGGACAGCSLYTYAAGTTTPQATYTDSTGTSVNTNPIILDAAGGAQIWLGITSYKLVLVDPSTATIWSVDNVPGGGGVFPCGTPYAIQIANSAVNGLTCDTSITINTTTHAINVGTLPSAHVSIGALGTPTSWVFDTTTPATALASLGGGTVTAGTLDQLAFYDAAGTTISGTSSIPPGITAITQSPGDNSTNPATTAYVALPGPINPTTLKVGSGVAMTGNQGNGLLVQHSTGSTTTGAPAVFDANGNIIVSASYTTRTCGANGCYRISTDGTIEQWGIVTAPTSSATLVNATITFPLPFPTALQSLTISGGGQPDGTDDAYSVYFKLPSLTGATAVIRCSLNIGGSGCGAVSAGVPVNFYAIGY